VVAVVTFYTDDDRVRPLMLATIAFRGGPWDGEERKTATPVRAVTAHDGERAWSYKATGEYADGAQVWAVEEPAEHAP